MSKINAYNPTTGKLIKSLDRTSKLEINEIVKASHRAQINWAAMPINERVNLIIKAYESLKLRKKEMIELIHQEMGKTLAEATGEVNYYTSAIEQMGEDIIEALKPHTKDNGKEITTTFYDPLGVCASITPWNFPLGMPHTLMMPSLMAGNTVIFKPSEEVFLIGVLYAEILNEFLPQGVLQLVIGDSEEGQYLVESDVQLITFTGSQATGKRILETGAKDLKRVVLELGGKDSLIILDDADLEEAALFAANGSFRNAGQVCVSCEKIYIPESLKEDFLEKLKKYTEEIKIGSMIHQKQKDHVVFQVKKALKEGAKLEYGEINEEKNSRFDPVILSNLNSEMDIMVRETFGPVACVVGYKSLDEALIQANKGQYALGAVIFSKDTEKAAACARKLNAAMVGLNRSCTGIKGSPWVGALQSGYGYHGSDSGHRQMTQLRILTHEI